LYSDSVPVESFSLPVKPRKLALEVPETVVRP
jgi:hypothetical protein